MLINKSIANMFNGVSQQAAPLRQSSQCEIQDNAVAAVATGLRKRPPTVHLAKLQTTTVGSAFSHLINRDTHERYEVLLTNGNLAVYDLLTGAARPVYYPDGASYLSATDPASAFCLVTVADYTFVVNKTIPVRMSVNRAPSNPANVGYVVVAASPAQHSFAIYVNGTAANASLGESGGNLGNLSGTLTANLARNLGSAYSVLRISENVIKIVRNDGNPVNLSTSDTYGNQALLPISNGTARFSNLPVTFDTGYTIRIFGEEGNTKDSYYVEYKDGGWVEAVKPGTAGTFDASTLPHKLVRRYDGAFLLTRVDWDSRKTGDEDSNPAPSFVGRTINDVFFFRNRLGFLSDENILMSRAGEFFSFFGATARAVLDSDPIDIPAAHTKVSILNYAVPFNKVLLLFSDQTQFQLTAGDILAPKTVRVDVVTEFESNIRCRPAAIGQELFFPVERGNSTGLREYFVDANNSGNDAVEITAHVPTYLPSGIFKLAASSNEDTLIAVSSSTPNILYLYKFYWNQSEKMQSAWGRILFPDSDRVLEASFIGTNCYLVIQRIDGIYLESMDFQPYLKAPGLDFEVHLDRRVLIQGEYNSALGLTTWTLPYQDTGRFTAVLGWQYGFSAGAGLNLTQTSANTLQTTGNYAAYPVYVGRNYTMQYRFSEQYLTDRNNAPMLTANLKLRRFILNYSLSGYFRVEVTPLARQTYVYKFTGANLGTAALQLGRPPITSGSFKFPVQTSNIGVAIDIINDTFLPSTFQSAEWEAEVAILSKRS